MLPTFARAVILLCLISVAQKLVAEEQTNLFESPRFQGRGRAHVAGYDTDESSRFNPATLGETQVKFQLRPAQLDLFVGQNSLNFISNLLKLMRAKNSSSKFFDFLRKIEFGKRLYERGQLGLMATRFGGLELSPFVVAEGAFDVHNPTLPSAGWRVDSIAGMGISYGWPLSAAFDIGLTARPLHRWYSSNTISTADILDYLPPATKSASQIFRLRSGWGIGVDAGLIWKLTKTTRIGLSILNVGDTDYFQDKGEQPPALQQTVNLGITNRIAYGLWNLDLYADGQGLMNRGGVNITRLLHFGSELGRPLWGRDNDIGLLAGLSEGYLSYGMFLDAFAARLSFSNYTAELGQYPGQLPDRRWGATLSTSLTF